MGLGLGMGLGKLTVRPHIFNMVDLLFCRLLRQVFTMYDTDRKGVLSVKEVCF